MVAAQTAATAHVFSCRAAVLVILEAFLSYRGEQSATVEAVVFLPGLTVKLFEAAQNKSPHHYWLAVKESNSNYHKMANLVVLDCHKIMNNMGTYIYTHTYIHICVQVYIYIFIYGYIYVW